MRADARRNRDRVLRAARDAFAESGFGVPLDEIATRAGVGPGTVYRHFPTKQALFHAVVMSRVADLIADARRRASDPDPGTTFFGFLGRLGAEGAAKRDTIDAIEVPGRLQGQLQTALTVLLTRAQGAGAVRSDISGTDLVALLKGLLTTVQDSADTGLPDRVLAVLIDGLRAPMMTRREGTPGNCCDGVSRPGP